MIPPFAYIDRVERMTFSCKPPIVENECQTRGRSQGSHGPTYLPTEAPSLK